MNTARLHTLIEELASCFSEVTVGDLRSDVPTGGDVGDLFCAAMSDLEATLAPLSEHVDPTVAVERNSLSTLADLHGGGFDSYYRRRARVVEAAFETSEPDAQTGGDTPDSTVAQLHDALVAHTESKIAVLHELLDLDT